MLRVTEFDRGDPERHRFALLNGRIPHGRQFAAEGKRRWATTYYYEESGVGRAIEYFRDSGSVRAGIVGLGVGTLAAYARSGDVYRFYEINRGGATVGIDVLHLSTRVPGDV